MKKKKTKRKIKKYIGKWRRAKALDIRPGAVIYIAKGSTLPFKVTSYPNENGRYNVLVFSGDVYQFELCDIKDYYIKEKTNLPKEVV